MLIEAISCVNTAIKCDSTTPLIQAVWVARQTKKLPLNAEHSAVVRMLPHAKQTLPKETVASSKRSIMPQILGAQHGPQANMHTYTRSSNRSSVP